MGQRGSTLRLRGICRALLHLYALVRKNPDLYTAGSARLHKAVRDYLAWAPVAANRAAAASDGVALATTPDDIALLFPKPLSLDVLWVQHVHMLWHFEYCRDMQRAFGRVLSLGGDADVDVEDRTPTPGRLGADAPGSPISQGRGLVAGIGRADPESSLGDPYTFRPSVDLVAAAASQRPFLDKIVLYLTAPDSFLDHCVKLYAKFMRLSRQTDADLLVPSIPVDIAWRAHLTRPGTYRQQVASLLGGGRNCTIPVRTFQSLAPETQLMHYRHTVSVWSQHHRSDMLAASLLASGGWIATPSLDVRAVLVAVLLEVARARHPQFPTHTLAAQVEATLASVRPRPPEPAGPEAALAADHRLYYALSPLRRSATCAPSSRLSRRRASSDAVLLDGYPDVQAMGRALAAGRIPTDAGRRAASRASRARLAAPPPDTEQGAAVAQGIAGNGSSNSLGSGGSGGPAASTLPPGGGSSVALTQRLMRRETGSALLTAPARETIEPAPAQPVPVPRLSVCEPAGVTEAPARLAHRRSHSLLSPPSPVLPPVGSTPASCRAVLLHDTDLDDEELAGGGGGGGGGAVAASAPTTGGAAAARLSLELTEYVSAGRAALLADAVPSPPAPVCTLPGPRAAAAAAGASPRLLPAHLAQSADCGEAASTDPLSLRPDAWASWGRRSVCEDMLSPVWSESDPEAVTPPPCHRRTIAAVLNTRRHGETDPLGQRRDAVCGA